MKIRQIPMLSVERIGRRLSRVPPEVLDQIVEGQALPIPAY